MAFDQEAQVAVAVVEGLAGGGGEDGLLDAGAMEVQAFLGVEDDRGEMFQALGLMARQAATGQAL
ncbi:hypothetical protein GCM10009838_48040 [Catenulispora subtropica]|uniref:Uncharacterized protein n=1 Tax=Catenulispora subtropica TaxID=450798 RepID=A0ABP5DJ49_9ACTN